MPFVYLQQPKWLKNIICLPGPRLRYANHMTQVGIQQTQQSFVYIGYIPAFQNGKSIDLEKLNSFKLWYSLYKPPKCFFFFLFFFIFAVSDFKSLLLFIFCSQQQQQQPTFRSSTLIDVRFNHRLADPLEWHTARPIAVQAVYIPIVSLFWETRRRKKKRSLSWHTERSDQTRRKAPKNPPFSHSGTERIVLPLHPS